MALSDRKIPIITGRNDTPTTSESENNHPNGSYVISKYNALIDNELTTLENAINNLDAVPTTTDDLSEGTTNKYFADSLARNSISVTGNGSYDPLTGVINISNATIAIDHLTKTATNGLVDTYTIYGDSGETIIIDTFDVTNGQDGVNGTDGQGIDHASFVDNGNGTHTLTLWGDVGETINMGSTTLNDGVDGTNGVDGTDGKGITNASYSPTTGAITLTFSDSTTFTTGDLRGSDGVDGTNGTDGVDGTSVTVFVMTQSAYDALGSYDTNTFYVING